MNEDGIDICIVIEDFNSAGAGEFEFKIERHGSLKMTVTFEAGVIVGDM